MSEMKTGQDRLQGAPSGLGSHEPNPSVSASGFDPSRVPYRPISSAPATGEFLAFNRMTGWYVTRREGDRFPLHGWDGSPGVWYPEPTFWMPLPPAPGDERPSGRDLQGLGGDSPASAVDEVEAPDTIDKLKRENAGLREALLRKFEDMARPSAILLACGEMPAQERRTAQAVANWYLSTARTLLSQSSEGGET